jgi:hypothetical protein
VFLYCHGVSIRALEKRQAPSGRRSCHDLSSVDTIGRQPVAITVLRLTPLQQGTSIRIA